jgi:hypothetical protein
MPLLADTSATAVRASTYRLLRHFINSAENIDELRAAHLDTYFVKALSRDHRCDLEKQQVLRTIRHILRYPGRVSIGVAKAVVALAENGEDKLRLVSLELLAELGARVVRCPTLLLLPTRCAKSSAISTFSPKPRGCVSSFKRSPTVPTRLRQRSRHSSSMSSICPARGSTSDSASI